MKICSLIKKNIPLAVSMIMRAGGADHNGRLPFSLAIAKHQQIELSFGTDHAVSAPKVAATRNISTISSSFIAHQTSSLELNSEQIKYVQTSPDLKKILPSIEIIPTDT